ncbi:MAG: hypothetical protein JXA74_07815 [Anaerolineae bacterium]|nr:hypothetical protein [Anaerolineae bacterium]
MGVKAWWQRFQAMPDAQRARLLALVLGSLVLGTLYGLGGLSLYLRASFLAETPTRLRVTKAAADGMPSPAVTRAQAAPTGQVGATLAPTLYPTVTPDLTRTEMAAIAPRAQEGAAVAPYYTATPYPTPTAGPPTPTPTGTDAGAAERGAVPTRSFR